jgi:hypothetical protein
MPRTVRAGHGHRRDHYVTSTCAAPDGNTFVVDTTVTFTASESYHGVETVRNESGGPMKAAEGATTTTAAKRVGDCTK